MNRTKQILQIGKIAVLFALILLCVSPAYMKEKGSRKTSPQETRLVLAPKTHLQAAIMPMGKDSAEAIFTIAVPDSCKNQRHLCRIEASQPIRLVTEPRYKWALRGDTLMVLSAVPLQIRLPRQSASGTATVQLRFHYQNLDRNAKEIGTATLELLPEEAMARIGNPKMDSTKAPFNSTPAAPSSALPIQFSSSDSNTAGFAADGGPAGIIYVVIAILLILFFGFMSWLLTWSQRRRQNSATQNAATAFPRFQHMTPAATGDDSAGKSETDETHTPEPLKTQELALTATAFADVSAAASSNGHDATLTAIVTQLHELSATVQQILSNQHQANQQLAQMANSTFAISSSPTTLALFDILNDDPGPNQIKTFQNGKALPSQLRIQFAESSTDSLSVKLGSSALEVYTNAEHKINGLSVNLAAPSKLRILFASAESNNEPAIEPLPAESSVENPLLQ